jgi:hypothetical protein
MCEYGGCPIMSGARRRCPEHARAHAARMKRLRVKPTCQCGALTAEGDCPYYKSGRHIIAGAA